MANDITSLITSVKRRASVPTSQNLFGTQDFVDIANEQLQSVVIPLLVSVRESFFEYGYETPIVANQKTYSIPTRAIGSSVVAVQLVTNGAVQPLPLLDESSRVSDDNDRMGFYIRDNNILVSPTPTTAGQTLRILINKRPGILTQTTSCGQITSINTGTNQVTVSSIPSSWTTNTVIDFVQNNHPYSSLAIDQSITSVSGTTITFSSLPTNLAVNDWVCPQYYSPIVQVPLELGDLLAQSIAVVCLRSMGNMKMLPDAEKELENLKQIALKLLSPRVESTTYKLVNNKSLLNTFRRFY